jgi:hypothetical protein
MRPTRETSADQTSIRECTLRFALRWWAASVFEVDVVNCLTADAANGLIRQRSLARPQLL